MDRLGFEPKKRTIKSEELLHVFNNHKTLLTICLNAKERSISDKTDKYLIDLGLDIVGKKKNKREHIIKEYFDNVQKDLEDNAILNLVAMFEKLVFNRIPIVTSNSIKILNSNYISSEPFSASIKSFVKTHKDINNISGVLIVLSGSISVTLENKLKEIIDYRNRIAHGRRFGSESQLSVSEALEILDEAVEIALSKKAAQPITAADWKERGGADAEGSVASR